MQWKKELSTYDLLEVGEGLVLLQKEKERVENEKSKQASKFSSLLKQIEADRVRKTRMLEEKVEHIEEECTWRMDYDNGLVHYISVANGSIVKSREMTNEERQMKLFDDQDLSDDIPSFEESPRCHMKPMDKRTREDGTEEYVCGKCGSVKSIEQ